jgi:hypothetical protein
MGLDVNAIRFLLDARQRGASFERIATIGRQSLHIDAETLHVTVESYGINLSRRDADSMLEDADGFCEPFFPALGRIRSLFDRRVRVSARDVRPRHEPSNPRLAEG